MRAGVGITLVNKKIEGRSKTRDQEGRTGHINQSKRLSKVNLLSKRGEVLYGGWSCNFIFLGIFLSSAGHLLGGRGILPDDFVELLKRDVGDILSIEQL